MNNESMLTYVTTIDGTQYTVLVGQNRHDNWRLIDDADPTDIWFHASGSSSAHVFLHAPADGIVPPSVVQFCSEKTKHRDTVYTPVGNIRKGKHIGEAIIVDAKLLRRATLGAR